MPAAVDVGGAAALVVLGGTTLVVNVEAAEAGEGDDPPAAAQPTRVELMEISSYQNVLVSPPYDSQPKYTPVGFDLMVDWDQPAALGLLAVVSPAMATLLSHVSMLPSVPMWYSKHSQAPVGKAVEEATPCGDRSGSVASSVSRLNMRMEFCPPIRRCLLVAWAASVMVIKETWLEVSAFVALL